MTLITGVVAVICVIIAWKSNNPKVCAILFGLNAIIPDAIPFADEILMGVATAKAFLTNTGKINNGGGDEE